MSNPLNLIIGELDRHGCNPRRHSDNSVRADCPECGKGKRFGDKLSVGMGHSGGVILNCFAGCSASEVLGAMGLTLADLYDKPIAHEGDPRSRRDRNRDAERVTDARRASVLGAAFFESTVICLAAERLVRGEALSDDDMARLRTAWHRLGDAHATLNPHARCWDGGQRRPVTDIAEHRRKAG